MTFFSKQTANFLIKKETVLLSLSLFCAGFVFVSLLLIAVFVYNHAETNVPMALKNQLGSLNFWAILAQNTGVAIALLSGSFFVKVPTVLLLLANGAGLGFVLTANMYTTGQWLYFIALISVHGIIELTALMIAGNIGFQKIDWSKKTEIKKLINTIILIITMLIIAAAMETYVTPLFWR